MTEPRPPTGNPPAAPRASPVTAVQAQDAPKLAPIAALLDARAQEDAQRLEKTHAEHRVATAMLLRAHRDELRAQSEADAARTTELLREVFAEHRAELRAQSEADAARTTELLRVVIAEHRVELARANQTHADHLAQILAQHQPTDQRAAASDTGELRAALLEQASLQRQANEDTADHITALTTIVADLGQTVGMLAVAATQKAQQSHISPRATFTPPPRIEPATAAHAASPHIEPASAASASGQSATTDVEPANTIPTTASPPAAPAGPSSSEAPPAAAHQPTPTSPVASLADTITSESPRPRPIDLKLAREAAERARLQSALDDEDDRDLETDLAIDDDDLARRRRLPPITEIVRTAEERDDD